MFSRSTHKLGSTSKHRLKRARTKWAAFTQQVAKLLSASSTNVASEIQEEQLPETLITVKDIGFSTTVEELMTILVRNGCSDVTESLILPEPADQPVDGGGLGDVYEGKMRNGTVVAIKRARVHAAIEDQNHMQNTVHEIYVWSRCQGDNILHLYGLACFDQQLAMVSPWMKNGNLPYYIENYPFSDRCKLAREAADGLAYLHGKGVVHGDIKGPNMLVCDEGNLKIADFGNAHLEDYKIIPTKFRAYTQSTRYSSPQIFEENLSHSADDQEQVAQKIPYSREADVYALGMTILEILTGQVPRANIRYELRVIALTSMERRNPPRPEDVIPKSKYGDQLWSLLERCWSYRPEDRPQSHQVAQSLAHISHEGLTSEPTGPSEIVITFARLQEDGCPDKTAEIVKAKCRRVSHASEPTGVAYNAMLRDGTEVLLKPLRFLMGPVFLGFEQRGKTAAWELNKWSQCKHKNVLPLLGIALFGDQIMLVLPHIKIQDALSHLFGLPHVNRSQMCLELAEGLSYLHEQYLIQRDFSAFGIGISDDGIVKLIACSNVILEPHLLYLAPTKIDSLRAAPETRNPYNAYDKSNDIYALGLAILKITTGKSIEGGDNGSRLSHGQPPLRPYDIILRNSAQGDDFWSILERCWFSEPKNRPRIQYLVETLRRIRDEGLYTIPPTPEAPQPIEPPTRAESRTSFHIQRHFVNSTMPASEIIEILTDHSCREITEELNLVSFSDRPVASGATGEIYIGNLHNGARVALKCLRLVGGYNRQSGLRKLAEEIYVWSKCVHQNVLKLLGIATFRNQLVTVSPWMSNGSMNEYIDRNPQIDRLHLLTQIAEGVAYIHSRNIVHGDLKGMNILISEEGVPQICDFGASAVEGASLVFSALSNVHGFSTRWTAPERIEEDVSPVAASDVYSLGMTILECVTGAPPFAEIRSDIRLMVQLSQGVHPQRPTDHIPPNSAQGDALWALLNCCWERDPRVRPTAAQVRDKLATFTPEGLRVIGA